MTRVGLVDCSWSAGAQRLPPHPSPALLRAGRARADAGDDVVYLGTSFDGAAHAAHAIDELVFLAPPWADAVVRERASTAGVPVQIIDPWAMRATATPPAYNLAAHDCHGEVDVPPSPVHPWVVASPPELGGVVAAADRLRAAFAGLAGLRSTAIVLGDERVPFTHERMRFLAELVSASLRDRKSMVNLYLRAWPADVMPERMLDHLSLLPLASLDLLIGTFNDASLRAMNSPLTGPELAALLGTVEKAGLSALTTLSIVAGLPGEPIDQSVQVLDATLRLAARHGIPRVRVSMWLGADALPPRDPLDQKARFLAAHDSWTETEYRGFHDLVAVIRGVAPNIDLVGPGFLPEWDEVP